jgi:hypothetical protein
MRDLSLHILDLVENSLRAGASQIAITLVENPTEDHLTIVIEDNGSGLNVTADEACDPFYTTKNGKRTGLGLSLFKHTAEQAGGSMCLCRSRWGGVQVRAEMSLSHVDRCPLGDLAATVSSVVCTNPGVEVCCHLVVAQQEKSITASDIAREVPEDGRCGLAVARRMSQRIKEALKQLGSRA